MLTSGTLSTNLAGIQSSDSAHQIAMKLHSFYKSRGEVTDMRRKYRAELQRSNPRLKKVVRCQLSFTKINEQFKKEEEEYLKRKKKPFSLSQKQARREKAIKDFVSNYENFLCIDLNKQTPAQLEKEKLKSGITYFQEAQEQDQKLLKDCADIERLVDYNNPFLKEIQKEIVAEEKEIVDRINLRREIQTPDSQRQKNRLLQTQNPHLKKVGPMSRSSVQFRRMINAQARKVLPSMTRLKQVLEDQNALSFNQREMLRKALEEQSQYLMEEQFVIPRKGSEITQYEMTNGKVTKRPGAIANTKTHVGNVVSPKSMKVQKRLNEIYSVCQGELHKLDEEMQEGADQIREMREVLRRSKKAVINSYMDPFADWLRLQKQSNPFTHFKQAVHEKY